MDQTKQLENNDEIFNGQSLVDHVRSVASSIYERYAGLLGPRDDGISRIEHADGVISVMKEKLGDISEELQAAAYTRYIIESYHEFYKDSEEPDVMYAEMMRDFVSSLNRGDQNETSPEIKRILGFAESAHRFNKASRLWEKSLGEKMFQEIAQPSEDTRPYYTSILACIQDVEFADSKNISPDYRVPVADLNLMLETSGWDIEGLILDTANTIQEIKNSGDSKTARNWRNAQKLYSFNGPLLDIGVTNRTKLKDLAIATYSESIIYLYGQEYTDVINEAVFLSESAELYAEHTAGIVDSKMGDLVLGLSAETSNTDFMHLAAVFNTVRFPIPRIKSIGRIIDKARTLFIKAEEKRLKNEGTPKTKEEISRTVTAKDVEEYIRKVPDTVGMKLIIPDSLVEGRDVLEVIKDVTTWLVEGIAETPISIGRPYDNEEAPVSIDIGKDTKKSIEKINGSKMEIGPQRESGYQSAHLNFHLGRLGIEIQIVTESMDRYNNEEAHHILYVNSNGNGEQYANQQQLEAMRRIRARFGNYEVGAFGQTWVSKNAINEMLGELGLAV